jgi:nicotinamide riboside kinase
VRVADSAAGADRGGAAEGALRIAIVGAECTGKSTLAAALAPALAAAGARRVAHVSEWLREWCERSGRTPRAGEQAAILQTQQQRIDAAAAAHDIVVCDTTPLMTAVYSRLLFGDRSLEAHALALHARCRLTLLTALDLPWVADGHQRDGEPVREPVDALLRELLHGAGIPFAVIGGRGGLRLERALAAVRPHLPAAPAAAGLFTRLVDDERAAPGLRGGWTCECCIEGEAERALRSRRPGEAVIGG